ncbi:MAG: hypothetical protein WA790_03910 [Sulfitobacter sp.]
MNNDRPLRIYLEQPLLKSAEAGEHNFINLMMEVACKSQFRVCFHDISERGQHLGDHSLTHMKEPPDGRGLVFRRAYQYPFWQIEQTNERWHWDVAKGKFDESIARPDAARFYGYWQKRLFGDAPQLTSKAGYIYVPLQGRLDQHRSFQACSPLDMIKNCLLHEPNRKIVATLHPNEIYTDAELKQLEDLEKKHAHLSISMGEMSKHLQHCDYVVTQNSSAAFAGYFFGKPALLFGKIDFHHIAEKADMSALTESFARVAQLRPAYDKYVWWFWQHQSINAGRDDALEKIAGRFQRFGWPID